MSNPSVLGVVLYADESSFSESSTTFGDRLPTVNAIDVSGLTQERIDLQRTVQRRNENWHFTRGPLGGSFTIEGLLTGHGTTTAGAITATDIGTLFGRCIGASITSQDGGTVAASPTDADTFTLTGVTGSAGGILRVGALGDGRCEGQATIYNDGTEWDVALPAAPNAADVVYAMELVHPDSSPTSSAPTTMRFQLITGNQRYNCHGCVCTGLEFTNFNPGEIPRWRATFMVSRWNTESASTYPSTATTNLFSPAPNAAGSLFYNTTASGTPVSTRQTVDYRDFSLSIEIDAGLKPGPGSPTSNQHEMYVGAYMNSCKASFSFSIDAEAAGATTWDDVYTTAEGSLSFYHFLLTNSAVDGRSTVFYFPYCTINSPRPTQSAVDGYNRQTVSFDCQTSATTTSELTLANWVLGLG